jgi:multidrug efflux pump subunit AcrA (membrane-fusion protein)
VSLRNQAPTHSEADLHADARGRLGASFRPEPGANGRRDLVGKFKEQPLLNTALLALCLGVAILAYTAVGPASSSGGQGTRTTTVKRGVVQSTVSGSGNIQSSSQLNLGFKTSGTVTHIYFKAGQQVAQGQLLATLDSKSSEVTLEQGKAALKSAEANLAQEEEHEGETSSSQGSSGAGTGATAASASVTHATDAGARSTVNVPTQPAAATTPASPTAAGKQKTAPRSTSPSSGSTSNGSTKPASTGATSTSQTSSGSPAASSTATKQSAATREANLASARASVKSDKLTVQSDEQAVQNTKLYAPESGTVVSRSGEVGETVAGTGTTKASSSANSSSSSSSSGGSANKGASSGGGSGGGSSSPSSSSSSSTFAVLSNLDSLQLVVALSESEIGNVHEGQIATVAIEALSGRKVAAHVVSVGQVPASSGAVSYDVTFKLDQGAEGLKVGMSATAEVVVKEAEGINVPTSAIKGGSVAILRGGKQVTQPVTTGLAGDSSTIVLSGLNAGEQVVLPTTSTSGASLTSRLGSRGGSRTGLGGALGGGGFPGGGFAGGGPPGG